MLRSAREFSPGPKAAATARGYALCGPMHAPRHGGGAVADVDRARGGG